MALDPVVLKLGKGHKLVGGRRRRPDSINGCADMQNFRAVLQQGYGLP